MSRSNKGNKLGRQRSALQRLEQSYEQFKAAHQDKLPWETTRHGRKKIHAGRSYEAECERLKNEITLLKAKMVG